MWESLKVENFRGFRSLEVRPLRRVNVLVGLNNTGKTSLLEGAFLLRGFFNPQLPFMLNAFRGRQFVDLEPMEIWGWLFRNKEIQSKAILDATGAGMNERLEFELQMPKSTTQSVYSGTQANVQGSTTAGMLELRCHYKASNGDSLETTSRVFHKHPEFGLTFDGAQFRSENPAYYLASRSLVQDEDAKLFSELQKKEA